MSAKMSEIEKQLFSKEFVEQEEKSGMIGEYCDTDFPFYYANSKMAGMLGYDSIEELQAEIKGKVSNTIYLEDLPDVLKEIGSDYHEGMTYEITYRMPRRDGTWFWTVDKGKVIKTEDGRLAIISICTDMTEFVQRKNELELE